MQPEKQKMKKTGPLMRVPLEQVPVASRSQSKYWNAGSCCPFIGLSIGIGVGTGVGALMRAATMGADSKIKRLLSCSLSPILP